MKRLFRLRSAIVFVLSLVAGVVYAEEAPLRRIAFGSCNAAQLAQPIWKAVVATDPDLWIWTGDIVYPKADSLDVIRATYAAQKKRPEYASLLEHCRVIGTWDDHDYGLDNGGAENPIKVDVQRTLLDFLDEPADSPRRNQAGVYATYSFGPEDERVQVILLDTRYHRDAPGPKADILGAEQWTWLEKTLREDDADFTILVSSIQVIPTEQQYEKWSNFPASRERLLRLISESRRSVVVISGDRHFAEFNFWAPPSPLAFPIYEVTSSGLTHSWKDFPGEPNHHRSGNVFADLNFGLITIDWHIEPVTVSIEIRDVDGVRQLRHQWLLSQLNPSYKRTKPR